MSATPVAVSTAGMPAAAVPFGGAGVLVLLEVARR
jgi:hypothetical protein